MKFVVSKTALEQVAKNICRVIERKNPLPILSDIYMKADAAEESLTLTGSDSEIWLFTTLAIQNVEGEGSVCMDANKLSDALAPLSEQPITIETDETQVRIIYQDGETYFATDNAMEYPVPPSVENEIVNTTMPAIHIANGIKNTIFAVADDKLRPIMNGVHFNFTKEYTDVVGSNGHILMRYRVDDTYDVEGSFTMPKKVANMLPKMLECGDPDEMVDLVWNGSQVRIEQGCWILVFNQLEARYPNYEAVIPKNHPFWVDVDRDTMVNLIKRVAPFTSDASDLIICHFEKDKLRISGEDCDFAEGAFSNMATGASQLDGNINIGFKAASLAKVLTKMPYLNITMHMANSSLGVTFTGSPEEHGHSTLGLLMPMMINN